jgi:hypothetical protein
MFSASAQDWGTSAHPLPPVLILLELGHPVVPEERCVDGQAACGAEGAYEPLLCVKA